MTTEAESFIGSEWADTRSGGRAVTVLRWGGNGVWFRYSDDGSEWHCCAEDFFLWRRFAPLSG